MQLASLLHLRFRAGVVEMVDAPASHRANHPIGNPCVGFALVSDEPRFSMAATKPLGIRPRVALVVKPNLLIRKEHALIVRALKDGDVAVDGIGESKLYSHARRTLPAKVKQTIRPTSRRD